MTDTGLPVRPSVFAGVPDDELDEVLASLERRRYPVGSIVIAEGDDPDSVYIVRGGQADVTVADRHGVEHFVSRVGPGAILGEMSQFTGQPASGTVRATTELDVLVMADGDFEQVVGRFPIVYRNISAILAERLASANRAAVGAMGRVALVLDSGAPPELPWAFACSVAWHTRSPTVLLVVDERPPEALTALAAERAAPAADRASLVVVPSFADLRRGSLVDHVEELFLTYDHVVVVAREAEPALLANARVISLAGERNGAGPAGAEPVVRAWRDGGERSGPDKEGVLSIPKLVEQDIDALRGGSLPPTTGAGRALGWLARDFAGLKVGIALGAGSIRGYAHVGVLQVLERAGLRVDCIAGTSIGSAVAGLHAMGYSPAEVADLLDQTGPTLFRPTLSRAGLLSSRALRRFLQGVDDRLIEDLPLPLALVAADLTTRCEVIFRSGPCWLGVLASITIPGVYPALRVGGHMLVDGGVLNPVPTNVAADMGADIVIGVRLAPAATPSVGMVEAVETAGLRPSALSVIMNAIEIMQARIVTDPQHATTIAITPELDGLPTAKLRNFAEGRRYIEAGEAAAETALARIATFLPWLRN